MIGSTFKSCIINNWYAIHGEVSSAEYQIRVTEFKILTIATGLMVSAVTNQDQFKVSPHHFVQLYPTPDESTVFDFKCQHSKKEVHLPNYSRWIHHHIFTQRRLY
ncbi:MAG: hypothetical protein WBX01_16895 [Nitrososphaeraceae archaeon]